MEFPLVYGMYRIEIGPSETEPSIKMPLYKIINSDTGVIEAETSSLPRAIMSAQSAKLALIRLQENLEPSDEELMALEFAISREEIGDGRLN